MIRSNNNDNRRVTINDAITTRDDELVAAGQLLWDIGLAAVASGQNCILWGGPGTGKTHGAMTHDAEKFDMVARIQCHEEQTAEDILGRVGIVDASTVFMKGVGARCVESFSRSVWDEINRGSQPCHSTLYSIADHKAFALADGTMIEPDARHQAILTTNENPWDIWDEGHGIRDRFPAFYISEPHPDALLTVHELFRATARRAVRYGKTGFRAWQHFESALATHGMTPEDALLGCNNDGEITSRARSVKRQQQLIDVLSVSCFGTQGKEIVVAWRVAAARDLVERGQSIPDARLSDSDRVIADAVAAERQKVLDELAAYASRVGATTRNDADSAPSRVAAATASERVIAFVQRIDSKAAPNGLRRHAWLAFASDGTPRACRTVPNTSFDCAPAWVADAIQLPTHYVPVNEFDRIVNGGWRNINRGIV